MLYYLFCNKLIKAFELRLIFKINIIDDFKISCHMEIVNHFPLDLTQ
jgi:hypothetical protein